MNGLVAYPGLRFPEIYPLYDLREYLEPSWTMGASAWHFRVVLEHNTARLHLRTRRGTNHVLVPGGVLPQDVRPAGQEVIPAVVNQAGVTRSALLVFQPDGELLLSGADQGLADGTVANLIVRYEYQRGAS